MNTIHRRDFSRGWTPSHAPVNAPGFLRFDNCVLDERGVVSVRRGSAKINEEAFADLDVHSLFTTYIDGTRYRMAGVNETVYANGVALVGPMAGAPEPGAPLVPIHFGSMLGQIFMARSTSKHKYDGTTARTWGIAAPTTAPTVTALAADSKTFATCDNGESPGFAATEGAVAQATGYDGTANGGVRLTADAATARGTMVKVFAAATDFTAYDSGQVGTDDDLVDFYIHMAEPMDVKKITIMVDVNASSTNRFQDDYYTYDFINNGDRYDVLRTREDYLDYASEAEGAERGDIRNRIDPAKNRQVTELRSDRPVSDAGWTHITIQRGKFSRIGSTSGKNWSTVKAIQFVVEGYAAEVTIPVVRFDAIKILGGAERPLTGRYTWKYAYAYNTGEYVALSPLSPESTELELKAQGATVTIPTGALTAAAAAGDTFNEIWIYRYGGVLDGFYRTVLTTDVTDPVAPTDVLSDRDALVLYIFAQTDNTTPPDNIIGIAGPYYARLFCLTTTHLYPSRRGNPESFASGQAIRVADLAEEALWIQQTTGGLYIGTTKDIYLVDGDGDELPDLTIDLRIRNLNIASPPIGRHVAADGNLIVYLASDGWREFDGVQSRSIIGDTEMLWRGHHLHGLGPINIFGRPPANFSAAITHGRLTAITPEIDPPEDPDHTDTTGSSTLFQFDFKKDRWYRHRYSQSYWLSIHREPDGTMIAGDTAGFVWELDTGELDDGEGIPVVLWTPRDDDGKPLQRKDPQLFRMRLDTFTSTAKVDFHIHGLPEPEMTKYVVRDGLKTWGDTLTHLKSFIEYQIRITGSFATFKLYEYEIEHLILPVQTRGQHAYTNSGWGGEKQISGLYFRVNTLGHPATFTPLHDGVEQTPFLIESNDDDPIDYIHKLTGGAKVTEVAFVTDCPIELYDWHPLVMYRFPLARRVWDTGELDAGRVMTWVREIRIKVEAANDLTITPYFDDVAFGPYTVPATANKTEIYVVPVGRGYKGSVPRVIVTSAGNFKPYWMQLVERPSNDTSQKQRVIRVDPNHSHQPTVGA